MKNTKIKTIAMIDEDGVVTLIKVKPEDNVTFSMDFHDDDEINYQHIIVYPTQLKGVSINVEYATTPNTVFVRGKLGDLLNGICD